MVVMFDLQRKLEGNYAEDNAAVRPDITFYMQVHLPYYSQNCSVENILSALIRPNGRALRVQKQLPFLSLLLRLLFLLLQRILFYV